MKLNRCILLGGMLLATGLQVLARPSIVSNPQDAEVFEGEAVVFEVELEETEGVTYQWTRHANLGYDGNPFKGTNSYSGCTSLPFEELTEGELFVGTKTATLTITGATTDLSGDFYQCIVSDGEGNQDTRPTACARLVVHRSPEDGFHIINQPIDMTSSPGSTVFYNISVSGEGDTNFQWQRGGAGEDEWLNLEDGDTFSGTSTGRLRVNIASSANEETVFRCEVNRGEETLVSREATLTLAEPSTLTIRGIEVLPVGSEPLAISADGNTVVGTRPPVPGSPNFGIHAHRNHGFVWRAFAELVNFEEWRVYIDDVSGDGARFIGRTSNISGSIIWGSPWYGEGDEIKDTTPFDFTNAISMDGTTMVGGANEQAASWTEDNGYVFLGDFPGGEFLSYAIDLSADNRVVVGVGSNEEGHSPFVWSEEFGLMELEFPESETLYSVNAVSADGSTIIGECTNETFPDSNSPIRKAFKWSQATGFSWLGDELDAVPGEVVQSIPSSVTADGSVVVGHRYSRVDWDSTTTAILWNEDGQVFDLEHLLESQGFDLDGWSLETAVDITPDGNTLIGRGTNTDPEKGSIWILSGFNSLTLSQALDVSAFSISQVCVEGDDLCIYVPVSPGWIFQLQYKTGLDEPEWETVGEPIRGNALKEAVFRHSGAKELSDRIFYRILAASLD